MHCSLLINNAKRIPGKDKGQWFIPHNLYVNLINCAQWSLGMWRWPWHGIVLTTASISCDENKRMKTVLFLTPLVLPYQGKMEETSIFRIKQMTQDITANTDRKKNSTTKITLYKVSLWIKSFSQGFIVPNYRNYTQTHAHTYMFAQYPDDIGNAYPFLAEWLSKSGI